MSVHISRDGAVFTVVRDRPERRNAVDDATAVALREAFDAVPEGFEFEPRWNAAPLQWLPVVRQRSNGERVIHRLRWGLVPSWSKDEAIATRFAKIGAGKFRPLRPMPSA